METKLNQKGCYYARPNGEDCSQYDEAEVNRYYDFCENCSRYHTCDSVALLDNKLKEIHGVE